jgi:hypothetical protein
MAETLHVVMTGRPRMAYAFEQAITNEGLRASSHPPPHEQGDSIEAVRYTFSITGDATLLRTGTDAAIRKLQERFPTIEFDIEASGDDDSEVQ